jgi:hypothetical protein
MPPTLPSRNLRAVPLLRGHTKLESTVRHLAIKVDNALVIAKKRMPEPIKPLLGALRSRSGQERSLARRKWKIGEQRLFFTSIFAWSARTKALSTFDLARNRRLLSDYSLDAHALGAAWKNESNRRSSIIR